MRCSSFLPSGLVILLILFGISNGEYGDCDICLQKAIHDNQDEIRLVFGSKPTILQEYSFCDKCLVDGLSSFEFQQVCVNKSTTGEDYNVTYTFKEVHVACNCTLKKYSIINGTTTLYLGYVQESDYETKGEMMFDGKSKHEDFYATYFKNMTVPPTNEPFNIFGTLYDSYTNVLIKGDTRNDRTIFTPSMINMLSPRDVNITCDPKEDWEKFCQSNSAAIASVLPFAIQKQVFERLFPLIHSDISVRGWTRITCHDFNPTDFKTYF